MSGALIGNNKNTGMDREPSVKKSQVIDEVKTNVKEERNARDRDIYQSKRQTWKEQKDDVDNMTNEELLDFLKSDHEDHVAEAERIGMLSMKVNKWEYALICYTRNIMNFRGIRQAIVKMCLKQVNIWRGERK